jgi:hypothetical protein
MKFMVFDQVKLRLRGTVPAFAFTVIFALAALLCLGPSPVRAQSPQEDTNPVNSMLGFFGMQFDKDKEDIDYRARAPLVIPPRLDLPAPKQAARGADWPKDPQIEERRHAAVAAQRPAPQITPNTRVEMSAAELQAQRHADAPAAGPPDDCQAGAGTPICLYTPWKLLQSFGSPSQINTADIGVEPPRKYLTEPPPGYRKPTAAASATIEAPHDTPDESDPKAYIRSQQHKTSVDN